MGKIILRLDRMMVERKISLNELAERVGISNVEVADKTSGTLEGTMTATGTADTLVYDLSGDVTGDYDEVSNETKNLTFTVRDWNKTIAEYSNYITFTTTLADK